MLAIGLDWGHPMLIVASLTAILGSGSASPAAPFWAALINEFWASEHSALVPAGRRPALRRSDKAELEQAKLGERAGLLIRGRVKPGRRLRAFCSPTSIGRAR